MECLASSGFHNVALVLSAVVTMLSAWDAFFNHRALWVRYTTIAAELKAIRSHLNYATVGGTGDDSILDQLFAQYQAVLKATNEWWLHQREAEEPVKDNPQDE